MIEQHVGFTGTQRGLTDAQLLALTEWLRAWGFTHGHHGDCVEGDEAFDGIATMLGMTVIVHPPTDPKKRAFCSGPRHVILPEKPYLERNSDIVTASHVGIACPKDSTFPGTKRLRGQGTWSTAYKFSKAGKPCHLFLPSGNVMSFELLVQPA